jgi:hypothetical protein
LKKRKDGKAVKKIVEPVKVVEKVENKQEHNMQDEINFQSAF